MENQDLALDEIARTMKGQPAEVVLDALRAATDPDYPWDETVMLLAAREIAQGHTPHFTR